MTLELPTVAAPTTQLPAPPLNPNIPTAAKNAGDPNGPLIPNAGIPTQSGSQLNALTVLQAIAQGILPLQVLVASYTPLGGAVQTFNVNQTPTLSNLMALGIIPGSAPIGTLAFANPTNYGGM
jgi:hypothetical protein